MTRQGTDNYRGLRLGLGHAVLIEWTQASWRVGLFGDVHALRYCPTHSGNPVKT